MNAVTRLMILGVVSMVAGILIYALWDIVDLGGFDIMGTNIIGWCREHLGRIGISSVYFFGGAIITLRSYIGIRRERDKQQDGHPRNY